MTSWVTSTLIVLLLALGVALYIRLHWHHATWAYRAMIASAVDYFVAGGIVGAWILHLIVRSAFERVKNGSG
jgi:hypothetical protein